MQTFLFALENTLNYIADGWNYNKKSLLKRCVNAGVEIAISPATFYMFYSGDTREVRRHEDGSIQYIR